MTAKKQSTPTGASGPAPTELENLLKRLQADFDNYRKRVEQEKSQIIQSANANLLIDLLPVLDNFKRASQHIPENIKNDSWATGVQAIEKQLEEILIRYNLEPIEVKLGDQFDPIKHEVVSAENQNDSGKILKVIESGYTLGGKILRPAKVTVG